MIYSKDVSYGGVWHCPFPPEWVEKNAVRLLLFKKNGRNRLKGGFFSTEEEYTERAFP